MSVPWERIVFKHEDITVFVTYMGLDLEDREEQIKERREKVAKELGIPADEIIVKKESA